MAGCQALFEKSIGYVIFTSTISFKPIANERRVIFLQIAKFGFPLPYHQTKHRLRRFRKQRKFCQWWQKVSIHHKFITNSFPGINRQKITLQNFELQIRSNVGSWWVLQRINVPNSAYLLHFRGSHLHIIKLGGFNLNMCIRVLQIKILRNGVAHLFGCRDIPRICF